MNLSVTIAANLKRLRQERNLSLGQLAELSQVSKVMLGQIEKGVTNPTINTLWKIANGLKVPYTQLIDETESDLQLILKKDRMLQEDADGKYRVYNYYHSSPRRNFELFILELDAGIEQVSVGHSERSQEYLMVIEGQLCLTVGEKKYELCEEDAIYFDASMPHTYLSTGRKTLKATIINYYMG